VGRGCFNGTEDIWFVFVLWIDGSGMEEVIGRVKGNTEAGELTVCYNVLSASDC